MTESIDIFISYAHEDEAYLKLLETHLSALQRRGLINIWHDRNISAGTEWASKIDSYLNTAHMILLLISPDFFASDYCYSVEMMQAINRHEAGDACIIPIILRPTYWQETHIGKLLALPTDGKPVIHWPTRDDAFFDITGGLLKAIAEWKKQQMVRKITLFGYEVGGGITSHIWKYPLSFSPDEQYTAWWNLKKNFTPEEIVGQSWVKISHYGDIFLLRFSDEGRLRESLLSDPGRDWPGTWEMKEEMLRLHIDSYELDVFANREISTYSAVECMKGEKLPHAYFTFFPIQTARAKHWDLRLVPFLVDELCEQVLNRRAAVREQLLYGSLLHRGEMSARGIVKLLGFSPEYRQMFIDVQKPEETIVRCYEHFLDRTADGDGRTHYSKKVKKTGFDAITIELIESPEYSGLFGEDAPPQIALRGLAAVSRRPNHLECFYRGRDHQLCHRYRYEDGQWSNEGDLGGVLTSAPAAISWGPSATGRIDCFYRGSDSHLWHRWYDGSRWQSEQDLGGFLASAPAVASLGPSHLDCFYRGSNGHLWHRWGDGNIWSDEDDLGGVLTAAPAVVCSGPDRIDCIIRGEDQHLWHRRWEKSTGWREWENLSGPLAYSAPAVASWQANRFDCFFRGENKHLWHRQCSGSTWGPWEDLGDTPTSAPTAVCWGSDRIDCFYRGESEHLWHKWWNDSGWNREDLGRLSI
jgi:hypothetical protein